VLSWFKKKAADGGERTFKARVADFWRWYAEVAPRFTKIIDAREAASLSDEVCAEVDKIYPRCAWVFGPGEAEGHSFTLTGEGNPHRQLLMLFWKSLAPEIPGWTFYPARQPGPVSEITLDAGGQTFSPIEFWLTPSVDRENEKIDLTVWHPLYAVMPENERWTVLFLFLDEALGEYGTQQRIGEIKLEDKRLAESIPIKELRSYVEVAERAHGWKRHLPGAIWTGYRFEQRGDGFLRADIITGTTSHMAIVNEYARAEGNMSDPLAGTGADFVFVAFDSGILPKGQEIDFRGGIEEALSRALEADKSGRVLGGACGKQNTYIDLLLFDGRSSLEIVRRVLAEGGLPSGTSINYFAKEKRGHRLVL
jgi:hypothetical protein